MKTQSQLKTEVYNALIANATLPDDIYWIARPTIDNTFPLIVYSIVTGNSDYVFTTGEASNTIVFQIDLYTDIQEIASMDTLYEAVRTVMHSLNYRCIDSGDEILDTDIGKIVRPSRWEIINV